MLKQRAQVIILKNHLKVITILIPSCHNHAHAIPTNYS